MRHLSAIPDNARSWMAARPYRRTPVLQSAAILALAALAGCQASDAHPVATGGCQLNMVADLPARIAGYSILVPARLDGKTAELAVDVSPTRNYVLKAAAARMKLDSFASTGGEDAVDIHHFELGGLRIDNLIVTSPGLQVWSPAGAAVRDQIAAGWSGGIGPLLLSRYDVEFDLAHEHVMLFEHNKCAGNVQHWPGPLMALSYEPHIELIAFNAAPYEDYAIRLPVTVNGHPAIASLSSTSPMEMQWSVANRLGVSRDAARLKVVDRYGFYKVKFYNYTVPRLVIDREILTNVPALINEWTNAQDDAERRISLGVDFFARNRVYIAYADHRVYFTPFLPMTKPGV